MLEMTPAPWHIENFAGAQVIFGENEPVATCYFNSMNAKLIAQAPAMYASLKAITRLTDGRGSEVLAEEIRLAERLIAEIAETERM